MNATTKFIQELKKHGLSCNQKRTLRGQAISGDLDGAIKGLAKILEKKEQKNEKSMDSGK